MTGMDEYLDGFCLRVSKKQHDDLWFINLMILFIKHHSATNQMKITIVHYHPPIIYKLNDSTLSKSFEEPQNN